MLFSLGIYISVVLCSILYCLMALPPYLLSLLLPARTRGRVMRFLILHYGRTVVYGALAPYVRVRFEDRAAGADDPGVYVFNHRSASDPFLVAVLGREVVQVVNGWPMKLPFFGYYARLCEYVDAANTGLDAMREHLRRLLGSGVCVMAFPEGTRSGSRELHQFHSGIFRLAMELGVPVYPCCIAGNEALPDRSFRFRSGGWRRGTVLVRRLPPVRPGEFAQYPSAFALKQAVRERILRETGKMDRELDDAKIHAGR